MILIDGVEILTVQDGFTWGGARDMCTRSLNFSILYNPLKEEIPKYKIAVGSKVEWIEKMPNNEGEQVDTTLFLGYVEEMPYNTDDDTISLTCQDFTTRLIRSKFIGRMKGTLNDLANNICGSFNIKNGINVENTHVHNIVSTGDLSYYDVLKVACETMFKDQYTLYMNGDTLELATHDVVDNFEIGKNIRSSSFTQSISDMVTKVLILDNNGKIIDSVVDEENLQKFGLFQEVYSYNKDCKNNLAEAQKLLKGINNKGEIVVNNNNKCISGRYIRIKEPVNNFVGVFEIQSDNHTIGADSVMTLEVKDVPNG